MKFALFLLASKLVASIPSATAYVMKDVRHHNRAMSSTYNDEATHVEPDAYEFETVMDSDDVIIAKFLATISKEEPSSLMAEALRFFYGNKKEDKKEESLKERELTNTIAKCTISETVHNRNKSLTIYMKLTDAEQLAKRLEHFKRNREMTNNVEDAKAGDRIPGDPEIKCSTVVIDDEKVKCHICPYYEAVVPGRHERTGGSNALSVLECINGYDRSITTETSDVPYFIVSSEGYHPICVA